MNDIKKQFDKRICNMNEEARYKEVNETRGRLREALDEARADMGNDFPIRPMDLVLDGFPFHVDAIRYNPEFSADYYAATGIDRNGGHGNVQTWKLDDLDAILGLTKAVREAQISHWVNRDDEVEMSFVAGLKVRNDVRYDGDYINMIGFDRGGELNITGYRRNGEGSLCHFDHGEGMTLDGLTDLLAAVKEIRMTELREAEAAEAWEYKTDKKDNLIINQNSEELLMAKKSNDAQEQTEEKKVRKTGKKQPKQEEPQAQAAATEKKDVPYVRQGKNDKGEKIPGFYILADGKGNSKTMSKEEKTVYFEGFNEMTQEQRDRILPPRAAELASKANWNENKEAKGEKTKEPKQDGTYVENRIRRNDVEGMEGVKKEVKVLGIYMVQDGKESRFKPLKDEDRTNFFDATRGNGKEVRDQVVKELQAKYFPGGFEQKTSPYKLQPLADDVKSRIQNAYISTHKDGKTYLHATIDDVQKLGIPFRRDNPKDQSMLNAYYKAFKDMPEGDERKSRMKEAAMIIAADSRFHGKQLSMPSNEQKRGMAR